jgi:hypothetical protein
MGFTTIHSTQLSASGSVKSGTARVKSIYVAHSGTAGTVILRDGGVTGTVRCTINTAAAVGEYQTEIPEPGIHCTSTTGPYIAVTGGVSFVTVFYD